MQCLNIIIISCVIKGHYFGLCDVISIVFHEILAVLLVCLIPFFLQLILHLYIIMVNSWPCQKQISPVSSQPIMEFFFMDMYLCPVAKGNSTDP